MFDWATQGVSDWFIETLGEWVKDMFEAAFVFLAEVLFNPSQMPALFNDLALIFTGFGSVLLVCIAVYQVIKSMIETAGSGGSQQKSLSSILLSSLIACSMLVLMPFMLLIVVGQIVFPIGEWLFSRMGRATGDEVMSLLSASSEGNLGGVFASQFILTIVFGFIAVTFVAFTIKMCIYYADLILLQVLAVPAAISIVADENNYSSVWWREVLAQATTIVLQTAMMAGVVELLTVEALTWYNLMLLVGLCALIIKGPSVTRHMWYATGGGKATVGAGKWATRVAMLKR